MEAGAPNTPERSPGGGGLDQFGLPADAIAERVNAVIAAAEAAAAGIKEDAEAEAQSYLAGSKQRAEKLVDERAHLIAELTDSLITQATEVKREFDSLMNSLEEGQGRLQELMPQAQARAEPPAAITATPASAGPQPATAERDESEPERVASQQAAEDSRNAAEDRRQAGAHSQQTPSEGEGSPQRQARQADRARLVAMQMALSGSGRGEIADRLRREFGVTDPDPILDELARSVGL